MAFLAAPPNVNGVNDHSVALIDRTAVQPTNPSQSFIASPQEGGAPSGEGGETSYVFVS